MTTIEQLQFVTLVSDEDTPNQYLPLVGKVVGVPPDMVNPLPTDPGPWTLYGIRGYARTNPVTGGKEWVMTDLLDRTTRQVMNRLPGPAGWTLNEGARTYRDIARRLLELRVPAEEVRTLLTSAFNAATVEATTRRT